MNHNASAQSLITRIEMFIQQENWDSARTYVEQVLDEEPENGYVYFLKMLVERKAKSDEELIKAERSVTADQDYPQIQLFGPAELVDRVDRIEKQILTNEDVANKNRIYQQAEDYVKENTVESVTKAVECFQSIPGWKDADSMIPGLLLKIKDLKYENAYQHMISDDFEQMVKAIDEFKDIINWKDSEAKMAECKYKIQAKKEAITEKAEKKLKSWRIKRIEKGIDEIKDIQFTNNMLELGEDNFSQYVESGEASIQRIRNIRKKIGIRLAGVAACSCVVLCGVLFAEYLNTNSAYKNAISLAENEQYAEAYELFAQKGFYKDSIDRKIEIQQKAFISQILDEGKTNITFGEYNGKGIEWVVLEVKDNEALLVSKKVLTNMQYNRSGENVPFEQTTLYQTLNDVWYYDIFTEQEQAIIVDTVLETPKTEKEAANEGAETPSNTEPKEEVKAKVFLLSNEELDQYFGKKKEKIAKGLDGKNDNYWLRTPAFVQNNGNVKTEDILLNQSKGVRPAIRIVLKGPVEVKAGNMGTKS